MKQLKIHTTFFQNHHEEKEALRIIMECHLLTRGFTWERNVVTQKKRKKGKGTFHKLNQKTIPHRFHSPSEIPLT